MKNAIQYANDTYNSTRIHNNTIYRATQLSIHTLHIFLPLSTSVSITVQHALPKYQKVSLPITLHTCNKYITSVNP